MKSTCGPPIRIGTSGIVLPGPKQTFPQEFRSGSRLQYYGFLFNTLEINSSFYKVPQAATFAKWASEVPKGFKFTAKLWRGVTHAKKLAYAEEDIGSFMKSANRLEEMAGCLLIQFPASIDSSYRKNIEHILCHINQLNENCQWRLVIEFRDASWYQQDTYDLLNKYNAAVVIHDMPKSATPANCPVKDVAYFRFHGPAGDYKGSYSNEFIEGCAQRIISLNSDGVEVYAYFNNTMGSAIHNAQLLQRLINDWTFRR